MERLQKYIMEVLGVDIQYMVIPKNELGMLPLFISETYRLYNANLFNNALILVEKIEFAEFSILQTEKHFKLIREVFNKKPILFAQEIDSLTRKRLVQKGINFIVPGKQLYLIDFLIDFRESFRKEISAIRKEVLLPSAQFIVLFRILHRYDKLQIEEMSFKELALKLDYTPMAITYAAENLVLHEICITEGEKEKYLRFNLDIPEMWHDIERRKLFVNPVLKKVYVDNIEDDPFLLLCNNSALPEYTNMNPSQQKYQAIEKKEFYKLQRKGALQNLNNKEGRLCLEVWKYNPKVLVGELPNDMPVVDPLSLYLSIRDNQDERTEMALEQLIEKNIW
jgi:hypothetical protein